MKRASRACVSDFRGQRVRALVDGRLRLLGSPAKGSLPQPARQNRPSPKRCGEVAEWFKAHAWNACIRETVSGVRIPLSPPVATKTGNALARRKSLTFEQA